jgi:hypothetical protein
VRRLCALTVRLCYILLLCIYTALTLVFVADSIVRAFLIEEAKVVKHVIKSQQKAAGARS